MNRNFRRMALLLAPLFLGVYPFQASAQFSIGERDQINAMQEVIDQQQEEITEQKQALATQQQRLDEQHRMLEALQSQMQSLLEQGGNRSDVVADSGGVYSSSAGEREDEGDSEVSLSAVAESDQTPGETSVGDDPVTDDSSGKPRRAGYDHFLALDTRPLDIPDDTGIFIYSRDETKMLRLYGSLRALAAYDNRQNFHAYDLNIPQVPYGDADVKDWNQDWTINTTKVGFEVGVRDYFTVLGELDWKGENGDALRIRHMYMRTNHWVIGKHWTSFNTLPYLPLSVDSHSTSAHLGVRPVQIKYIGGKDNWLFQASAEYFQPKFQAADGVDASASNLLPNLGANVSYVRPWGQVRLSGMLTPNKVEGESKTGFGSSSDTGLSLMLGTRLHLNENNVIKAHIARTNGLTQGFADFGFEELDMAYNPASGEFENLRMFAGQIALEHHWTPTLSTSIGAGYMDMDNKSFQPADDFDQGYKALVNLFYRPAGWLKGLTLATELEFAGQKRIDQSRGDTTRISVLMYYDW